MKIKKYFRYIPYVFFVSLVTIPFIITLPHTYIQSYTDFFIKGAYPYQNLFSAWSQQNFGSNVTGEIWRAFPLGGYFYILSFFFHIPANVTLFILLVTLHLIAYVYFVKVAKLIINGEDKNQWPALLGGLFYVFNTYTLTQLSNSFLLVLPYLLLPLQFYLFIKSLREKKFIFFSLALALISSIVLGVNLIFSVIALTLMALYGVWSLLVEKTIRIKKLIIIGLTTMSLAVALSFFWIVPQLYSSVIDKQTTTAVLQSENFYNNDSSIPKVLRGLGDWGFFSSNDGVPYYGFATNYKSNIVVIFAGFAIPVLAMIPLLLKRYGYLYKNSSITFFYLLFLMSITFIGGTHVDWPTARIIQFAFDHIPYFMAFRNTYKFGTFEMLSLAMCLIFSLLILSSKLSRHRNFIKLIFACTIMAILINAFPYYTNSLYNNNKKIDSVPNYWNAAASYINTSLPVGSKILILPNQYFEVFKWNGELKGFPRNLEETLFNKPVVHNTCKGCGSPNTAGLLNYIYENTSDSRTYRLAANMGITDILQRNDYASSYYNVESPATIKYYLNNDYTKRYKTFGQLDLYKIDSKYVNNQFYSPSKIIETSKYGELNDALSTSKQDNSNALTLSDQIDQNDEVGQQSDYFKRLFDNEETSINGNLATDKIKINSSNSYVISQLINSKNATYDVIIKPQSDGLHLDLTPINNELSIDNNKIGTFTTDQVKDINLGKLNNDVAIKIGNKSFLINPTTSGLIGDVSLSPTDTKLDVYDANTTNEDNLAIDGSFENGLWQNKVLNCQQTTANSNIKMALVGDASSGGKALQLSASQDTACTFSKPLNNFTSGIYLYRIDTKNISGHAPSYCVWNGDGCVKYSDIPATANWTTFSDVAYLDQSSANFYLYLYSQKGNYSSSTNQYDNIRVYRLDNLIKSVDLDLSSGVISKQSISLTDGDHYIKNNLTIDDDNLIDNGSFDYGPWQPNVSDCSGNNLSTIDMRIINRDNTAQKALELISSGDTACSSSDNVKNFSVDDTYKLSFEYLIKEGSQARVCVWDGKECVTSINLTNKHGWQTYETLIQPKKDSRVLSIYIYAPSQVTKSIVDYDNISLKRVKNNFLSGYELQGSAIKQPQPLKINSIKKVSNSEYRLNISNVQQSILAFQETYHPGWNITFVNGDNHYSLPQRNHFIINTFANGWLINSVSIPKNLQLGDGSYDIIISFSPQHLVSIGLIISTTTLVVCIGYLSYAFIKKRKSKKDMSYKDPHIPTNDRLLMTPAEKQKAKRRRYTKR